MDSVSVGVQLKNIVYMRTREVMLVIRSWKKNSFCKRSDIKYFRLC